MANELQIQICDLDTYQHVTTPLDQLHGLVPKVPFIRIYGTLRVEGSETHAYNVLVHVHNYYPYVYIDCPNSKFRALDDAYLKDLKNYFNQEIQKSFQKRAVEADESDGDIDDDPDCNLNFVACVEYCRGAPVYGYHLGFKQVLRVLLLLPLYKTRLVRLITSNKVDVWNFDGKIKRRLGIPNLYEAHIPYTSQFLADYNLYGCAYLRTKNAYFRAPLINHSNVKIDPLKSYLKPFLADNNILQSKRYPRIGRSLLEIDIHPKDILNRSDLIERRNHNDFSEFNKEFNSAHIHLSSLKFTFEDLKYQCILRDMNNTSQLLHELYSQVFSRIGEKGYQNWETLERYRELIAYVAKLNGATNFSDPNTYYDNVIKPSLNGGIPTCFESIDRSSSLDKFQKLTPLSFQDDLKRWADFDSLFIFEADERRKVGSENLASSSAVLQKSISDDQKIDEELSPSRRPHQVDMQISSSDLLLVSSSSLNPQSADPSQKPNVKCIFTFANSRHTPLKRSHSQVDSYDSNSLGSAFTQSLHCLVKNPKVLLEYTSASELKKSNFTKTLKLAGMMEIDYNDPSYSNIEDVHAKPLIFANKKIVVPHLGDETLTPYFDRSVEVEEIDEDLRREITVAKPQFWQYIPDPPTKLFIRNWAAVFEKNHQYKKKRFRSQIEPAVTQTYDFKYSYRSVKVARNPSGFLNMTTLHMEVHVNTTSENAPNPHTDAICAIVYHFDDANSMFRDNKETTVVMVCPPRSDHARLLDIYQKVASMMGVTMKVFESEKSMISSFLEYIDLFDPDILSGYEINASSWGYLVERYNEIYEENLLARLSRSQFKSNGKFGDRWGYTHTSALKINGRHLLNIWRVLRSELSLTSYSLENVCFHLLHQTLPKVENRELSMWFLSGNFSKTFMLCKYLIHRVGLILKIMSVQEIVLRNVEQSRLIGVDFNSNFYRGSQFKVESILLRIAKEENMLLNSPSKNQVHDMRALDSIPLIMEPDSNFYKSPLVVLDFQSLYPSIMIAYNYCYSTLLGPIEGYEQNKNVVGYLPHLKLPRGIIDILLKNDGINISPNGMMFVSSRFRRSILSRMLQEILNMRINVKAVAGAFREDIELAKLYNLKQLALKLIANVTYGYTSASFSGRMPNSDIADAIVSTGREILTKSIEIIEGSPFEAKVVYGDTDSLFVYFPGRSKEQAFEFGKQLAKDITEFFPDPIKLKFEKIYHPSVLLAKKRYVGQCYEFEDQKVPKFEAKGIETIRRDGIPAQLKMVGKSLRILFETKDLSKVKLYVIDQFQKIFLNKVNVKDFCFAKEVRYGSYKNEKYLPPGAILAQKKVSKDPRSEPQYRERIPYLVTRDSTKERVKDRCVSPDQYVSSYSSNDPLELDFEYYITRVLIPPLERVFNLMGVNIQEWYREMPKSTTHLALTKQDVTKISDIVQYDQCYFCQRSLKHSPSRYLCQFCYGQEMGLAIDAVSMVKQKESQVMDYERVCTACIHRNFANTSSVEYVWHCTNGDCQIYYGRVKCSREYGNMVARSDQVMKELDLQW